MENTLVSGTLERVLSLLEDHVELAHLEYRFESDQARREAAFCGAAVLCAFLGFTFLQIALIIGLLRIGIPLYVLCLFFSVFYGCAGVFIYHRYGKRDPRVGEPFQGTREEAGKSLRWIHQLLS